jgi:hypothetical protein
MSETLRIQVRSTDAGANGGNVAVSIRPVEAGEDLQVAATIGAWTVVNLATPGSYVIDAILPSGEHLREVRNVRGPTDVMLVPKDSPHEWLGFARLFIPAAKLGPRRDAGQAGSLPPPRLYRFRTRPDMWRVLTAIAQGSGGIAFGGTGAQAPTDGNGRVFLFNLPPHDSGGSAEVEKDATDVVLVDLGSESVGIPVPRAWHALYGDQRAIQLVVNAKRRTVSLTVDDAIFAPVLAYLAAGRADRAAVSLGDLPLELLYTKKACPLAAAAAAYVLVDRLHDLKRVPDWRTWLDNLANWFSHMPDGLIVNGRALLYEGKPEDALPRFLDACDRGVPVYAEGVRVLLQGLLSYDPDRLPHAHRKRYEVATRTVRLWASWLDRNEGFTTLHLPLAVIDGATDEGSPPAAPFTGDEGELTA